MSFREESWQILFHRPQEDNPDLRFPGYVLEVMNFEEYQSRLGDRASYVVRASHGVAELHIIQCVVNSFDRHRTQFPSKYRAFEDALPDIGQKNLEGRMANCCFVQSRKD